MGLLLSIVISYAGILEAIQCIKHILSGVVPQTEPDFQDLINYYTLLLGKSANSTSSKEWIRACGQGYLCLTEDQNGKLNSAAVKYYDGQPNSTAILFSTKISSFGQDSIENNSQANGNYTSERYIPTKTKTIISDTSESFRVGTRNRSPTSSENISDPIRPSANSFKNDAVENNVTKEKLSWHYSPLSPDQTLPDIQFQSYDDDRGAYNDDFLRSLDGIKFRPLQRSDPSGRRRSFKKRSSSSTSSKDSRASREEELKIFTSLEDAEFGRMNSDSAEGFGSSPNLSARSYSRSRSRESSKERKHENWSVQASVDGTPDAESADLKPQLKDLPKLHSFEEETKENEEVTEEDEFDFWANSGD